jgi:O-antigen/teichoic acid export membrane protein
MLNYSSKSTLTVVFKNTAFIMLGSFVLRILNFLFRIYIVRSLGDERFGRYSTVLAFVGIFQIFVELGMTQYFMREVSRDRAKANEFFWNLVATRMLLAIVGIFGITYASYLAGYSTELMIGVGIFTITFLLSAVDSPIEALLVANERFDYVTAKNVLSQITFVGFGAIFMYFHFGFLWLIVAGIIGQIPQIGLGVWAVLRQNLMPRPVKFFPSRWHFLMRSGLPFGIISLSLSITYSVDTVILKNFQSDQVVGWYNAAYGLIFTISSLISGFKDALVPTLSRAYISSPDLVERWYFRTVRVLILISLPIVIGGMLIAFPLIHFLFTDEYLPSALALQILIWDIPFMMFAAFCGNMTTIIKFEKYAARIYTLNAILNIVLNLILIPRYGMIAASIVTVVTDIFSAIQFYILLHKELRLPKLSDVILRTLLASGIMGLLVWGLGQQQLFLMIAVGVLSYLFLVVGLRILDRDELAFIQRVFLKLRLKLT